MATTSVWAVNDNLKRVLDYAANKEKTESKDDDLSNVLAYAANADKTDNMSFVSGINLDPAHAYEQMVMVKKQFNKTNKVVAFHGYHSFSPGEVDPVTAHNMTRELMDRWLGNDFQVLLCTHLDQGHIHTHFVINSVSWTTGKRFLNKHSDYRRLRELSDEICKEHGLSIIENPGFKKHYAEVNSERQFKVSNRTLIVKDVEYCISISITWNQFVRNLEKLGYQVKYGKYFTILPPGGKKYYRTDNLSKTEDYSMEAIKERIRLRTSFVREVATEQKRYRLKGNFKNTKKITGIRALYFRYLYELGILPKHKPRKYIHPAVKKDLYKLKQITDELTFMNKKKMSSLEEIDAYKSKLNQVLDELTKNNRSLCNKINRCNNSDKKVELINEHDQLLKRINELRKEVRLCDSICKRNESMKNNLDKIHEDKSKEEIQTTKKKWREK